MIYVEGITEEMINGNSLTKCKKMIDEALIDEWQSAWYGNNKGKVTYSWIKNVSCVRNCYGLI